MALLAYTRAARDFERLRREVASGVLVGPAAELAREDAVLAMRRAYAQMERVYGRPGDRDVHWPVPVGASAEALGRVELQCGALLQQLLRARAARAPSERAPVWLAVPLASISLAMRDHGVTTGPTTRREALTLPTEATGSDALATYRRAFAADEGAPAPVHPDAAQRVETISHTADGTGGEAAAGAPPPAPSARLQFARWLVRSGRLSDG